MLPRQADSKGIILVKLKKNLNYWGNVIFEPVRPTIVYEATLLYSDVLVYSEVKRLSNI